MEQRDAGAGRPLTRRELRALQATGELPAAPVEPSGERGDEGPSVPPAATPWAPVPPDDGQTAELSRDALAAYAAQEAGDPEPSETADAAATEDRSAVGAEDGSPESSAAADVPPSDRGSAAGSADQDPEAQAPPQTPEPEPEPEPAPQPEPEPDAWQMAVGWSLHQELPRKLPPEPEVDDVRWDPITPQAGGSSSPFPPVTPPAAAPADGRAAEPDAQAARTTDAGTGASEATAASVPAPTATASVPSVAPAPGRLPSGLGDDAPTPPTGVPVAPPDGTPQGTDQQGAGQQGADQQGADQQGGEQPGAGRQGAEQQGGEQPGADPQGAEQPGAQAAETDQAAVVTPAERPTGAPAPGVPVRTSARPPSGPRWPSTPPPAPAPSAAGRPTAGPATSTPTAVAPVAPTPAGPPTAPSEDPAFSAGLPGTVPPVPSMAGPTTDAPPTDAPPAAAPAAPAPSAPAVTEPGRATSAGTAAAPWPGAAQHAGAPAPPAPAPAEAQAGAELPTLTDLLAARPAPPEGPAESGWQGTVRRITGGLIAPPPGRVEQARRAAIGRVQRSLDGPKTVVVINPKGGAHKTTATMMLAATFGMHRGGYTLAWDNNETRGTLGWRSQQSRHHSTAVNLLQDLDRFSDPGSARVGDLDGYVRSQGSAQFDVLASDEDAASAASIDAFAFRSLHRTLSRFYRVMVVDTGNNMRASNWQAAIEAADQVVIVSTVREDTSQSAAWAVDALRATGHEDVVRKAVTVLSAPAAQRDDALADRLHEHFGRLTRAVLDVPYDPSLVTGRPIDYDALSTHTRDAWLHVAAAVADGL